MAAAMVGLAASPATAAVTVLGSGAWSPQSIGGGVVPEEVAILAIGAGGGSCGMGAGGTGAIVWGTLAVAPTDQLTAVEGTQGGDCGTSTTPGSGGGGGYLGGGGAAGNMQVGDDLTTKGGAGGGGSTVVYLNGTTPSDEVAVAGGGGGAGGYATAEGGRSYTGTSGEGGNADTTGIAGTDGGAEGIGIAGSGGVSGGNAQSDGPNASSGASSIWGASGGGGGGGGGAGGSGSAAATSGGQDEGEDYWASGGGGGAGGASASALDNTEIQAAVSADAGTALLFYVDITAGSIDNATTSGSYTGTTFTSDMSGTTWELVGTAGTDYPLGLTIDSTTGAISGSAAGASPGDYSVRVRATASEDDPSGAGLNSQSVTTIKTVAVQVTGGGGSETPTVSGISPSQGPAIGGTTVTITGAHLPDTTTVTIDGKACTDVVVASNGTSLTCKVPAGTAGTNVAVLLHVGLSSPLMVPGGYTYIGDEEIKRPKKPQDVTVTGGKRAKKYRVSWDQPADPNGNRPTNGYRLKVNRVGVPPLIIDKSLGANRTSYTITRKQLLAGAKIAQRGDVPSAGLLRFRVRVFALNSAGRGPLSTAYILLRR